MNRRERLVAVAVLCASLWACDGKDPCGDPSFTGSASDEAWLSMVDAQGRVKVDDAKAVTVVSPTEGQLISAAGGAPRIRWSSPLALGPRPAGGRPPRAQRSLAQVLSGWLVSEAWAHLPPVTDDVYSLELTIPGRQCPLRVFTTELEWQPAGEAWDVLQGAQGKGLSLQITSAYLRDNRITEGPYRPSAPRVFQVAP